MAGVETLFVVLDGTFKAPVNDLGDPWHVAGGWKAYMQLLQP